MKNKNQIAYTLGTRINGEFRGAALWRINLQKFEYADYYTWRDPFYILNWENNPEWVIKGELKYDAFKTVEEKILYIRGAINAIGKRKGNKIIFNFPNGKSRSERIVRLLKEIDGEIGRSDLWHKMKLGSTKVLILSVEAKDVIGVPSCTTLTVKFAEEFLNLILDEEI